MIKSNSLKKGDKIAIVSLSRGVLGEKECSHSLKIGVDRLESFGLKPVFMENALKGLDFIKNNPEARACDLKNAFKDDSIKAILCAIGGDDTYKILPHLLEDEEFVNLVKENPKIFIGFSDTTTNHLMFYKLGITTYYGLSFLSDIAELGKDMLPYSKKAFLGLFEDIEINEIISNDVWYEERTDFSEKSVGVDRFMHEEIRGFEVLQGQNNFSGALLGGCVETIFEGIYQPEAKSIYEKYKIFPSVDEWCGKVMFLETSEGCIPPDELRKFLKILKEKGIFDVISGIIVGKPQNEVFYEEYKQVYIDVISDEKVPILYNVNFGHALPRCILPYGVRVEIDIENKKIVFLESMFK